MAFLWLTKARRPAVPRPLKLAIYAYLGVSITSTAHAVLFGIIEPLRALLFLGKEAEFYLLFILTLHFASEPGALFKVAKGLLAGAAINTTYLVYQVATGQYAGRLHGDYGLVLVGVSTAFIVSGYSSFLILFALSLGDMPRAIHRVGAVFLLGGGALGIVGGMSRTSALALAVSIMCWVVLTFRRQRGVRMLLRLVGVIAIVVGASAGAYLVVLQHAGDGLAIRRMTSIWSRKDVESAYRQDRVENIYLRYFSVILNHPVLGAGKSITGTGDLPIEAHNHYIRVLAETGVFGLLFYLMGAGLIVRYSYLAFCRSPQGWPRTFAQCGLLFGVFMSVAALGQDCFAAVLTTELYWMLAAIEVRLFQWTSARPMHWVRCLWHAELPLPVNSGQTLPPQAGRGSSLPNQPSVLVPVPVIEGWHAAISVKTRHRDATSDTTSARLSVCQIFYSNRPVTQRRRHALLREDVDVTVIVPCRNELAFIGQCIESITSQTVKGTMEIIIVDGMSTRRYSIESTPSLGSIPAYPNDR